ncbi:NAD-dependent epimerase/dehydratase family protein [Candidatus Peregrinibacteria bacterium]|nr:NAD-dependent epimerase/dehydratase family protein [Candidatus Peregrinibacteria bacterium]
MRVLVTGGAGFIGSHIVRRLAPNHNVIVFDNYLKNSLSILGYDKLKNVKVVKGDILDKELVASSMEGADVVIHAAASIGVDVVSKDQLNTMQVNIIGTNNVLEAAQQHGVKGRVIVFSTSEIFGEMAYKVKETDPVKSGAPWEARWGYGISKIAGEHFAHAYHTRFGLPIVCVRPFNVYGPGQTMNGAMKLFVANALQNKDIKINGDGTPIRSWCYVDDFVDCILQCMTNPKAIGESFNIGNPLQTMTVLGLAERVIELLDSKSKVVHGEPLKMEIHLRIPCIDKAKTLLGFEPKIDLKTGILKTAESVREELKL